MIRLVSLIATHQEIGLLTHCDPPPIEQRNFDWSAMDDKRYDIGSAIGWGLTEIAAINSLFDALEAA